ncbi:phage portal protein [Rhodococcus tibetensis]|uniref:Phage portal protein n=1 Tax=Rhodococcus tibetensis TaxID=2965064 RepID=A0ABT1QFK2_9NOCA|nr:phage portal protein [Rhodococcus sp. FXJ9.536]MCQ4119877.1 phage portal protein [Rhodococcus sp. FXJ9.536]
MSFVVSEGSIRGLNKPELPPITKIQLADGLSVDYYELWRTQPAVRTTVSFLARNIAQLGIHTFRRKGDADRERLTDHPLAKLIAKPNLWTTRYRMMDALVHDLGIFDCAYWQKTAGPGLIRLPPPMVTPKGDNWLYPEYFEVKGSKGKVQIAADKVVFFRGYSGMGDLFGTSPLESLRRTLSEEYEASRMREGILRNGARVSGYLERPTDAKPWTPEARDRFGTMWRSQYTGNGPMVGGTPILEDGMTFKGAAQTAEELQYIAARKLTREEVAAAYFIPPPMIGILDHATFSNIEEQHKMLYADTLGPWLTMFSEEIALQLIDDLPDPVNVYVEFNLAEKLRGSFKERSEGLQKSVGAPYMTVNEARAMDNRPPLEGGDELVRPLNVTQNGDQDPTPAAPGTTDPTADDQNPEEGN